MRRTILILLSILIFGSPLGAQDRVIGFLNGVSNTDEDAQLSLQLAFDKYHRKFEPELTEEQFAQQYRAQGFYSETGCPDECIGDLFEVFLQLGALEKIQDFWELLDNVLWRAEWQFANTIAQDQYEQWLNSIQASVEATADEIAADLESLASSGSEIALVTHSQGNFFGNASWNLLSNSSRQRVTLISVATPDSYVAGGGNYTKVDCDFVSLLPGSLEANVSSIECPIFSSQIVSCRLRCHAFASYITGAVSFGVSEDRILEHMHDAFGDTQQVVSLIENGSFSQGLSNWTRTGDFWAGTELSNYYSPPGYAAGGVDINGYHKNGASGSLSQVVTIPTDAGTQAMLQLWVNVSSDETQLGARDFFWLEISDAGTGALLGTPISLSNANASYVGDYIGYGVNLSAYLGRSLRIKFVATSDIAFPTVFRVDNVSLVVQ